MNVIAFDTETCLFAPGRMAPELVCVTWQQASGTGIGKPHIVHVNDSLCLSLIEDWLTRHGLLLVGQNVAYDLAVLCAKWPHLVPLVFAKYDRDEITDTKLRQQLLDIAAGEFRGYLKIFAKEVPILDEDGKPTEDMHLVKGARFIPHKYDLDALLYRASGRRLDKDTWRLRYGEFLNVPLDDWPEGARIYPLEDARATLEVFLKQEEHVSFIPDQFRQARAAWALHLTSVWGLRTHGPSVDKLELETLGALAEIEDGLKDVGLVRRAPGTKADGTRNLKAARERMVRVCEEQGKPVRLTDKGGVSLDADACEASGDDLLEDYAELTSLKTVLKKDIPVLKAGVELPVHTSFGMAASGRTTSSKPNVQNVRRLPGIREVFIPRPGKIFAQGDYTGMEMYTLAQVCLKLFGQSELARVLNEGLDAHTDLASIILGISYEEGMRRKKLGNDEVFNNARQTAKVANFGFGGGLGADNLVIFAWKEYQVRLTVPEAKKLKATWLERWPETKLFFEHNGNLVAEDESGGQGKGVLKQLFSDRWRGGASFCALCNSWFQGLASDAAKRALYLVVRACYAESSSVLYGSRPVNFVHDEIILETDDNSKAHDVAMELGRVMVVGANEFLPDVPARVEPLLARCWSKNAKPRFGPDGRLVPWSP